jgi:hypothetical protein
MLGEWLARVRKEGAGGVYAFLQYVTITNQGNRPLTQPNHHTQLRNSQESHKDTHQEGLGLGERLSEVLRGVHMSYGAVRWPLTLEG